MYFPQERHTFLKDQALPQNGITTIDQAFPLDGSGWYKLRLILKIALTVGTGTTPIKEGAYKFLKAIYLKTSRGETILNGVPGLGLFQWSRYFGERVPYHDEIAASDGTYYAALDIPFVYPFLRFPEDTLLDTNRYNRLELKIQTGSVSDLLGTVGTATATFSLTLEVFKTKSARLGYLKPERVAGRKGVAGRPSVVPFIQYLGAVDPSSVKKFDLDSKDGLGYLGFLLACGTSWAEPFYSTQADNIDDISFMDGLGRWLDGITVGSAKHERWIYAGYDAYTINSVGLYPHLFVKQGSINEVFPSGGQGRNLRLEIGTVITGTNKVDCLVFGVQDLG